MKKQKNVSDETAGNRRSRHDQGNLARFFHGGTSVSESGPIRAIRQSSTRRPAPCRS